MPRAELGLPAALDGRVWLFRALPWAPASHRHEELEVNLVVAGRATYLVDDQRYDLSPGTQIWLFPAQDHVLIEPSADYVMWIGVFRPAMLARLCTDKATRELRRDRPTGLFCKQLSPDVAAALGEQFESLAAVESETALYNAGLGWVCLSAWRAHRQADVGAPGSDVHPAVERAARLIRDSHEPMSVEELAERAGLSASRLTRLFKRQTGISLTRYRQRQQLQRFLDLYGQGRRRTVTEAALAAGFGSYPQFHRVFKQHFGFGPAAYRRRCRESEVSG